MPTPPVTKKPIPGTPKYWWRETEGMYKYARGLDKLRKVHGDKWVQSMKRHAITRLRDLVDNPPRGGIVPKRITNYLAKETTWHS